MNPLQKVKKEVKALMQGVPDDHGYKHVSNVVNNVERALSMESNLTSQQRQSILMAAWLHEVDDRKIFKTENYENARKILTIAGVDEDTTKLCIELIDLVSCSKNKNCIVHDKWKLIPRDADRIEALGAIGIYRCYEYSKRIGNPLYTEDTPRARSIKELYNIATKDRFHQYDGHSKSMIDHFYDKLLHIGVMESGNIKLQRLAKEKIKMMEEFCLEFGKTGTIDEFYVQTLDMYPEDRYVSLFIGDDDDISEKQGLFIVKDMDKFMELGFMTDDIDVTGKKDNGDSMVIVYSCPYTTKRQLDEAVKDGIIRQYHIDY